MSDIKEEGTGELEDEQLSDVSGGAVSTQQQPGPPTIGGLLEQEGVVSPRDPASGLPTGKRQHKPVQLADISVTHLGDKVLELRGQLGPRGLSPSPACGRGPG